jgi:hypothetical protein
MNAESCFCMCVESRLSCVVNGVSRDRKIHFAVERKLRQRFSCFQHRLMAFNSTVSSSNALKLSLASFSASLDFSECDHFRV